MANKIYGLIGEKLGHSFSKIIHEKINTSIKYDLIEIEKQDLESFMKAKNFDGINVTIPFKSNVIQYCDFVDEKAKQIGAVNTICNRDNKLYGYNTDFDGFLYLLNKNKVQIENKKVVILGNGGTHNTVFAVCSHLNASDIITVSRNPKENTNSVSYDELESIKDVQIIINTTPIGMYPNNYDKCINLTSFTNLETVIDVIFNPLKTQLLAKADSQGIKTVNGLVMLIAQAKYAAEYFYQTTFDDYIIDEIYTQLNLQLSNLVLIGMPGCGKSTISKAIAKMLGKTFIDTDELIEKQINMSIAAYFKDFGEENFREIEYDVIREVSKQTNCVISTGGGIIKNPFNIKNLRLNGVIAFLNRDLDNLEFGKSRPLSSNFDDLAKIYNQRLSVYRHSCDFEVNNNLDIYNSTTQLIDQFEHYINEQG